MVLERQPRIGASFRKQKRKARLSFIMGLVCDGAIVMACESQTTRNNFKFTNAQKLAYVPAGCDNRPTSVLVAESGYEPLSSRAVDIFRAKCATLTTISGEAVSKALGQAVTETVAEHTAGFSDKSFEEIKNYFQMNAPFEVMAAFYCDDGKPNLLKVSGWGQIIEQRKKPYLCSGTGRELGEFLLDEYAKENMDGTLAILLSISIVGKVSEYMAECGGRANVGVLRNPAAGLCYLGSIPNGTILEPEAIDDYAKKIQKAESDSKQTRQAAFEAAMAVIRAEAAERFMKSMNEGFDHLKAQE
jgi:20S proteasome alpha/beta subunit